MQSRVTSNIKEYNLIFKRVFKNYLKTEISFR